MINHNYLTSVSACVVGGHPSVAECAVIARDEDQKGQVPMGLVVLKTEELASDGEWAAVCGAVHH